MKHERIWNRLNGAVLAFLVSSGGIWCIVTAYRLNVPDPLSGLSPVDFHETALWCAVISAVTALLTGSRKTAWIVPGGIVLAGLLLWQYGTLEESVEALCYTLTANWDMGYGWGVLQWSGRELAAVDRTLALCAAACVPAVWIAWTVGSAGRALWGILAGLLPMSLCVLLTDRVPGELGLFLWLTGMVLFLLTQSVRRRDPGQSAILSAGAAVPVMLALMLLFSLIPQEGYREDQRARLMLEKLQSLAFFSGTEAPEAPFGEEEIVTPPPEKGVDLQQVGERKETNTPVFKLKAETGGVYYLRGSVYDIYTGTDWQTGAAPHDLPWKPYAPENSTGQVSIVTRRTEPVVFLPYYTAEVDMAAAGTGLSNTEKQRDFIFSCYKVTDSTPMPFLREDFERFTALPASTQKWAKTLLVQICEDGLPPEEKAEAVGAFVRGRAPYHVKAEKMPADSADFARWFLEEADRGYCIHFATASAVLLRAAGIPARYVTGYLATAESGVPVVVTTRQAHAWTEYWTPTGGWQVLEATPASEEPEVPQTGEPTQPAETQKQTEPEEKPSETRPETVTSPQEAPDMPPDTSEEIKETAEAAPHSAWTALAWLGAGMLLASVIYAQRILRRRQQRRRRTRGTPNERALAGWQQVERLARLSGEPKDPALLELAEKAKSSPHTLTGPELLLFEKELHRLQKCLKARPWYRRLIYTVIYAAY